MFSKSQDVHKTISGTYNMESSRTQFYTKENEILKFLGLMIGTWKFVFFRKFPLLFSYRAVRFDA